MKLFWGLIVLISGGVLLSVNQGWLNSSIWISILTLWPIILIVLGLKLLIKDEKMLSGLTIGVVFLAAVFVILTYNNQDDNSLLRGWNMMGVNVNNQVYSELLTDTFDASVIKSADVRVSTGAVSLNIRPLPDDVATGTLYQVKTADMGKVQVVKTVAHDSVDLEIKETQVGMHFSRPVADRELTLYLPKSLLLRLNIDSGASKLNLDFSDLNVTTSDIKVGASSGDIYLGEKVTRQILDLDAGASSLTFHVPAGLGVNATLDGGLNTVNSDASLNIEKNDEKYVTRDFASKVSQIVITGNTGVSSLKFQAK